MSQSIAFFGASTGVGLATLKQALLADYTVVALCRNPDRLSSSLSDEIPTAKLHIKKGNAHDVDAVAECLIDPRDPSGKTIVGSICCSIGGVVKFSSMALDDPDVCKKGTRAILKALKQLRESGCVGRPLYVAVSTTGISKFGRDVPYAFLPMYHIVLRQPHADKKVMEEELARSEERFVLVRPSILTDGDANKRPVRVAVEDLEKGVLKQEIGYTISREETGQWIFRTLVDGNAAKVKEYEGKAVGLTW